MAQNYFCRLSEKMSADCCRLCKKRMPAHQSTLREEFLRYFNHHAYTYEQLAHLLKLSSTALRSWAAGEKFPHRRNLEQVMALITDEEMGGHPEDCPLARALSE